MLRRGHYRPFVQLRNRRRTRSIETSPDARSIRTVVAVPRDTTEHEPMPWTSALTGLLVGWRSLLGVIRVASGALMSNWIIASVAAAGRLVTFGVFVAFRRLGATAGLSQSLGEIRG
jgi:hypothetical protein